MVYRQTTYVAPVFYQPHLGKHPPTQHYQPTEQQQQQAPGRERTSQTIHDDSHGDGETSAPLDRRPARRTNPATVNRAPGGPSSGNDSARTRPSSYQGDYQVVTSHSHARPRILLIRSNTDRNSEQVDTVHLHYRYSTQPSIPPG